MFCFVFPPCLFPVAISVFNLTPAGGKEGSLIPSSPLKKRQLCESQKAREQMKEVVGGGAQKTWSKRHSQQKPFIFLSTLPPPPKTVRPERWDPFKSVPDKETFSFHAFRVCTEEGKEVSPPPTRAPMCTPHCGQGPWIALNVRYRPLLSRLNGFPMAISSFKTANYGGQTETPRIRGSRSGPTPPLQSDFCRGSDGSICG